MTGDLAFALTAGTLAAVNPCGFAMLPAYMVLFAANAGVPTPLRALRRATTAALVMTLGFITVFGTVGIVLTPVASSIQRWAPYLTVVIGVTLGGFGIAMLIRPEACSAPSRQRRSVRVVRPPACSPCTCTD